MAMSGTSSATEWLNFYEQQNMEQHHLAYSSVSEATTVTTTGNNQINGGSGSHQLSAQGRVTKPIRRRSRASRRTPTTLLNTDTSNFRAMVQQFTGAPIPIQTHFGFTSRNPNPLLLPPSSPFQQHNINMNNMIMYTTTTTTTTQLHDVRGGAFSGH